MSTRQGKTTDGKVQFADTSNSDLVNAVNNVAKQIELLRKTLEANKRKHKITSTSLESKFGTTIKPKKIL